MYHLNSFKALSQFLNGDSKMMLAAVQATDKRLSVCQYLMCISGRSALSLLAKRYGSCMSTYSKHISKRSAFREDLMQKGYTS